MFFQKFIQFIEFANWNSPYFKGKHRLSAGLLRWLPNAIGVVKSMHGFLFEIDAQVAKYQFAFGCETITSKVVKKIVLTKRLDVFMDIGANRGWFAMFVRSLDNDIKIFAFEPNPKTFSLLYGNVERNRFGSITLMENFVGSSTGTQDIHEFLEGGNDGMATGFPLKHFGPTNSMSVASKTLDDLFQHLDSKNDFLLKVDVEGAESEVIAGARQFLKSKPFLILELNPSLLESRGESGLIEGDSIHVFLQKFGYLQFWIDERGRLEACNQGDLPHEAHLGFYHGANYLFVHKDRLDADLSACISSFS